MGKVFFRKSKIRLMNMLNLKLLAKGIYQYWYQIAIMSVLVVIVLRKDMSFQFNVSAAIPNYSISEKLATFLADDESHTTTSMDIGASLIHVLHKDSDRPSAAAKAQSTITTTDNLANTYSNMTYHKGNIGATEKLTKLKKQEAYIARFATVAEHEMKKYGIPASITLAQGLIESNAGDSRLSTKNNNHFGIKCFSSKCGKGHCSNFTDDSHKDFFRKYATAWESYRAHSIMLQGKRYRNLQKLGTQNYKAWAHGLKKAGYATDPRYAEKLIRIIEELKLNRYDK